MPFLSSSAARRRLSKAALLALLLLWPSFHLSAAEIVLRLSSGTLAGSRNSVFFNEWAARISQQSKGTVRVEVRDGTTLASFGNVYDRVFSDVVQIGWGIHQAIPGKFRLTELLSLPQATDDWLAASAAFWRLYEKGLLGEEYDEIVPLALFFFGPAQIHFARDQERSFADLRGLRIGVVAKFPSELMSRLGGTPVSVTPTRAYEVLHRGNVDAVVFSWAGVAAYELQEVSDFHLEAPVGGGTGMIFMSRARYDSLPAAAREAIDANSGEQASRAFARHFQLEWMRQRERVEQMAGQRIAQLTPEELSGWWRDGVEPLESEWAGQVPGGKRLLTDFRDLLGEVQASP